VKVKQQRTLHHGKANPSYILTANVHAVLTFPLVII